MAAHALITGPITGRIPTPDPGIDGDFLDVTSDFLYFDDQATAVAVAHAIEDEHWVRGSHPVQLAVADHETRDDVSDEERRQAKAQHAEVGKRIEKRAKGRSRWRSHPPWRRTTRSPGCSPPRSRPRRRRTPGAACTQPRPGPRVPRSTPG